MPPLDPPERIAATLDDAAALLLARLEAETAALARLRGEMERAELSRRRIEAALDALAPALPPERARDAAARMAACRKGPRAEAQRPAPHAAILDMLAQREPPRVTVGDVQEALLAQGFALFRTYAAKALTRLAAHGVVRKTARGRYRVNRTHPEIVALRLRALEDALA